MSGEQSDIPTHDTSSMGHLTRVLDLLKTDNIPPRNYFYAAYELRCGIESRLKEYLSIQKDLPKKLRNGWQIAVLGDGVEKLFKSRDLILRFQVTNSINQSCVLLYTPVSKVLPANGKCTTPAIGKCTTLWLVENV